MSENLKRHRPDIKVLGEGKAIAFMPEDPMGVWCHIQEVRDLLDVKDKEIAELKYQVWEADERAIDAGATSHEKMQESEAKDNEIAELKEERRWRKCSESLPEDGAEVLATDGDGIWLCYKTTMSDGLPWFQPDGLPHIEGVTHWMPLPSAPKEQA